MTTDPAELSRGFLRHHPAAAAAVLDGLSVAAAAEYLLDLPPRLAAPVLAAMSPAHVARVLGSATAETAAGLIAAMPAAEAAVVLRQYPEAHRRELIALLPTRTRLVMRLLLRYPVTTVGAWMDTDVPALAEEITVAEAWKRLRREARTLYRYVYVVGRDQRLTGRIGIDALLRADAITVLARLVDDTPRLSARAEVATVRDDVDWRNGDPLPVVSRDGRFLGVAHYAAIDHAMRLLPRAPVGLARGQLLLDLAESFWTSLARGLEAGLSPRSGTGRSPRAKE